MGLREEAQRNATAVGRALSESEGGYCCEAGAMVRWVRRSDALQAQEAPGRVGLTDFSIFANRHEPTLAQEVPRRVGFRVSRVCIQGVLRRCNYYDSDECHGEEDHL